jgi:hypothetical protein
MLRTALTVAIALGASFHAFAFSSVDFSGTWVFNPERSKNIGVMSDMKLTTVIEQSADELLQKIDTTMMGQQQQQQVRFDLNGKPVSNETPMGEKSETVSKWEGPKLISTWKTPGAVPGTMKTSIETRYLSPDKKMMYVESSRTGKPPVVMAYDKK